MSGISRAIPVTATGTVFAHDARLVGVNLTAGTSATVYRGTAATAANKLAHVTSVGTVQLLPRVLAEGGLHVVLAGTTPEAIVFYE